MMTRENHKICDCAGRYECHYCGLPCYAEDQDKWKQEAELIECEEAPEIIKEKQ